MNALDLLQRRYRTLCRVRLAQVLQVVWACIWSLWGAWEMCGALADGRLLVVSAYMLTLAIYLGLLSLVAREWPKTTAELDLFRGLRDEALRLSRD